MVAGWWREQDNEQLMAFKVVDGVDGFYGVDGF